MLILVSVVMLSSALACFWRSRYSKNVPELWCIGGIVTVVFYLIALAASICEQARAPARIAELDEMRRMILEASPNDAKMEDVYGEAAKLNRELAKAKKWNESFLFDPWVPDSYAAQPAIEIQRAK